MADHDTTKGGLAALEESKDFKDILVIPAAEVTSSKGHIVALGIREDVGRGMSPEETVEAIRDLGGIAVAAHPFVKYRDGLCDHAEQKT